MISFSNARSLGTFVFVALLLLFAGLLYFSSPDLFVKKTRFVSYFQQNVKGLSEGAIVAFRGVTIGEVKEVSLVLVASQDEDGRTPLRPRVVYEIYQNKVRDTKLVEDIMQDISPQIMIDKGMRATLQMESFLTGKLYVSLDYYPEDKPRYLATKHDPHLEIPSLDRSLQGFIEKIQDLPFDELVDTAISTLDAFEALAENEDLLATLTNTRKLMADADELVLHLDKLLQTDAKQLIGNIDKLMVNADNLLTNDVRRTLLGLRRTLRNADGTLQQLKVTLEPTSPLYRQLLKTLDDFSDAARSLETLTDYLEQHPESILRGKPE